MIEKRRAPAAAPTNWELFNRRLDEVFGVLNHILQSVERNVQEESAYTSGPLVEVLRKLDALRDGSDIPEANAGWAQLNHRIDEIFGTLNTLKAQSNWRDGREVAARDRGLFVVGHARSGTSILADALNTSEDVYCFMEPYFYRSLDLPEFAAWFNKMHQDFGNPPMKGYWAPSFGGATARGVVRNLRETYRYVGEKLAFRQREKDYDFQKFVEFSVEEFSKSPFICVIRDPIQVTSSVIDTFEASNFNSEKLKEIVKSQLETYSVILQLSSIVPLCYLLFHESIDNEILATLGSELSINLEGAMNLYRADCRLTPHDPGTQGILNDNQDMKLLCEMHSRIRNLVDRKSTRIRAGSQGVRWKLCQDLLLAIKSL
jgi:hypothetical protein